LKGSDETCGATKPPAADTASPPASSPPARRFALTGPSAKLDPLLNAFRADVADIELAGRVVASHYAEPFVRRCTAQTSLKSDGDAASEHSEDGLKIGELFAVLDCNRGLAWGYRIADHRVGYVDQTTLGPIER